MNIYLRFFDRETLVNSTEMALDFLRSLGEVKVDEFLEKELRNYLDSPMLYPKRFKVTNRAYFIVIKTEAPTMEDFKAAGAAARDAAAEKADANELRQAILRHNPGWYEATILFKRVISLPQQQKSLYCDTTFRARLKADSIQHCYDRVTSHLKGRQDIDKRSQYPGVKNRNFECTFLGETIE